MNIKEIRLKTGLSQERFAAVVGVTCLTVGKWERGLAKPSPLALEKLKKMESENESK